MSNKKVRLATLQSSPQNRPKAADPFDESFSLSAAREWSRGRVEGIAGLLRQVGEAGADLVVTGEDIANLYDAATYLDDRTIFCNLVQETSGDAHQLLSEVARDYKMHIIACFFEPEGDKIYNSSVLFGRDGKVIGRYHKVHLPVYETWQVSSGDTFPAFETDLGIVGMLICYDQMWPESAAACALNGARIICHPSAATLSDYQMRTRAMDYQVFYISSTKQTSRIVQPNGDILADAGRKNDTFVTADVNVEAASIAPEGYWDAVYSGIRDHRERHLKLRRPEAYRVLVDPNPPALRAYPPDGLANNPKEIEEVYQKQKEEYARYRRGEKGLYHWQWLEGDQEKEK